jgi:hypothetical protein
MAPALRTLRRGVGDTAFLLQRTQLAADQDLDGSFAYLAAVPLCDPPLAYDQSSHGRCSDAPALREFLIGHIEAP